MGHNRHPWLSPVRHVAMIQAFGCRAIITVRFASRNRCPKGFYFRCDKVRERTHPWPLPHCLVHQKIVRRNEFRDIDDADQIAVAVMDQQRSDPDSGFDGPQLLGSGFTTRGDTRVRRNQLQPSRDGIVLIRASTCNDDMTLDVRHASRCTVMLNVGLTCIDGPGHFRDLASDKALVSGFARANREIGLARRQIENTVADYQFQLEIGVARVECIDKRCFPQTICDTPGRRHADSAGEPFVAGSNLTLESRDGIRHLLGGATQFLTFRGKSCSQ